MHHRRGKKKSARAGCSMCKPWKDNENKGSYVSQTNQEKLSRDDYEDQLEYINDHPEEKVSGGKPCLACKSPIEYDETFDAFYCPECKEWTSEKCPDPYCMFCANRPEKAI